MKKACFLDRDGVVIVEKNYLSDIAEVELEQGAAEAIRLLKEHGYMVIVVSNQSGVARGYFGEEQVRAVNAQIDRLLAAQNTAVDDWFYCPHHPKGTVPTYAVDCSCRKPEPGMLLQATRKHELDLTRCFMIGDKVSDIQTARNAGCAASVLVMTGHGGENEDLTGITLAPNILEAVKILLQERV